MSDNNNKAKLQKKINLFSLIGLGVGATVGAGIFSTISEVSNIAGSSLYLVLAFLIGALLQIPGSLCFAELTSAYPEDGGHYVYFREAGYKSLTFICAWLTFLAIDAPSVAVMVLAVANYLSVFLPWNMILLKIIAALVVVAFSYIHIRSVQLGGYVQAFITIIKIIPFVLIIGVGLFFIQPDLFMSPQNMQINSTAFDVSLGPLALFGAIAFSSYSFDGIFAGCYVSGEIKNPKRTLPLGLVLTAVIVLLLYFALSSVATGLMTIDEIAQSQAPIASMASKIPQIGNLAQPICAAIAIVVIVGTISSCLLYMPRFVYAMSCDNIFPKLASKVHHKYQTPYMSIIIFSIYVIILVFAGNISNLLNYLTLILLLKNFLTFMLIFRLRKNANYKPSYKSPFGLMMPIISTLCTGLLLLFSLFNSSWIGIIMSSCVILFAILAYNIWRKIGQR